MDVVSLRSVPQKQGHRSRSIQFVKLCANITVMVMKVEGIFRYFNVNRILYGSVILSIDGLRILCE
jgi:hypothetical protein